MGHTRRHSHLSHLSTRALTPPPYASALYAGVGGGSGSGVGSPSTRPNGVASALDNHTVNLLWHIARTSTHVWDRRLRHWNYALCVLAILHFTVVVRLLSACWDPRTLRFDVDTSCEVYEWSHTIASGLSVLFIATLVAFYYEQARFEALISRFPSRWSAFTHSPSLWCGLLCEILATVIQPLPLFEMALDLSTSQYLVSAHASTSSCDCCEISRLYIKVVWI
jgi:hypothetical protein